MDRRRPFLSSSLALSLALSLAGCSLFGSEPMDEAEAAFAAQDYIAAQSHAQAALAQDPEDGDALEMMARIQLVMGLGRDVLNTLARLERVGHAPEDANLIAAEARLLMGEGEAAIELIGQTDTADAWRLRALAAVQAGDDETALDAFEQGRSADGDKGKLLATQTSFHLDRGNLAAASDAAELAREVAPDRIETLYVSARLAEAQNDPDLALSNYLRIIEIAPMDRPALLAAIRASEWAESSDVTRHLIAYGASTRPMDREFVYQQARVEAWDEDWEAVRERLQAHEIALSNHEPARLLYAEALLHLGQVETARAIAAPIVARRPEDTDVLRLQAAIEAAS